MRDARTDFEAGTSPQYSLCCVRAVSGVHKRPDPSSPIDDQLLFGHSFDVARIERGWAYGRTVPAIDGSGGGYIGYVRAVDLGPIPDGHALKVSTLKAPIFSTPDIKSTITLIAPQGAICTVMSKTPRADFYAAPQGFIHKNHLSGMDDCDDDYAETAQNYLGLPYIWGGKSSDGLDCSGLVQMALWAAGIACPRDADQQEAALGRNVEITDSLSGLRRGDLVFWRGHVAIMIDAQRIIHANAHHMMTQIEPLHEARDRIEAKTKTAAHPGEITAIKRL
jgi:cell wall-associated NlpC family hydrolase